MLTPSLIQPVAALIQPVASGIIQPVAALIQPVAARIQPVAALIQPVASGITIPKPYFNPKSLIRNPSLITSHRDLAFVPKPFLNYIPFTVPHCADVKAFAAQAFLPTERLLSRTSLPRQLLTPGNCLSR